VEFSKLQNLGTLKTIILAVCDVIYMCVNWDKCKLATYEEAWEMRLAMYSMSWWFKSIHTVRVRPEASF